MTNNVVLDDKKGEQVCARVTDQPWLRGISAREKLFHYSTKSQAAQNNTITKNDSHAIHSMKMSKQDSIFFALK